MRSRRIKNPADLPRLYKELGPGERTALSKLAVQHLEETGRPLRLAIDVAIWHFQTLSGQGGKNPALRTLYFRLLKLLGLGIQPLFVFDGPHRPSFKRGKKIAPHAASLDNFLVKQLLNLFGFPFHDAPGEAEAECAWLQSEGAVDAVLSEDVDTLMFGCTLSLRNWTTEGSRTNKSPTHVDVYRSQRTLERSGLDCEGMILVALMSGGDYIKQGLPGSGPQMACQAARAGFGKDLCELPVDNEASFKNWRARLQEEIRSNGSKFFKTKRKTFTIPDTFPDRKVLAYYTHPVVSPAATVHKLRNELKWDAEVQVPELRSFVGGAFGWTYTTGAQRFIRGMAPALLMGKLIRRSLDEKTDRESMNTKSIAEGRLIKSVSERRTHWSTDGEPELRIAYIPSEVVDLALDKEELAPVGLEESDESASSDARSRLRSQSPTKKPAEYDPAAMQKSYALESLVKLGCPLLVETWEEDMRDPKKFATRKAREKATLAQKTTQQAGALDKFFKTTKPGTIQPLTPTKPTAHKDSAEWRKQILERYGSKSPSKEKDPKPRPLKVTASKSLPQAEQNPWSLAKLSAQTSTSNAPRKHGRPASSSSSDDSLPPITDLITPSPLQPAKGKIPALVEETPTKKAAPAVAKTKKAMVAVRESLEGAWKPLEAWEAEAAPTRSKRVFSRVETVDLTDA